MVRTEELAIAACTKPSLAFVREVVRETISFAIINGTSGYGCRSILPSLFVVGKHWVVFAFVDIL